MGPFVPGDYRVFLPTEEAWQRAEYVLLESSTPMLPLDLGVRSLAPDAEVDLGRVRRGPCGRLAVVVVAGEDLDHDPLVGAVADLPLDEDLQDLKSVRDAVDYVHEKVGDGS